MSEWLPPDHLAWFVLDVVDGLDTTGLEQCRRVGGAGAAGYDPRMLLALLVYAYCCGARSSRQIERLCTTDVAFRVLCAQDVPDHCTMARFGTVAIDGTKIPANASIDANRGQQWLEQQVRNMIADAKAIDADEDSS